MRIVSLVCALLLTGCGAQGSSKGGAGSSGPGPAGPTGDAGAAGAKGDAGAAGAAGAAGTAGTAGVAGAAGKDGTDNHVVGSTYCSGQLGTSGLYESYDLVAMATGDIFVSGSVHGSALESGGSSFYSSKQTGATTGSVVFTQDDQGAANGGFWNMTFSKATGLLTVVYTDVDAAGGKTTFVQPQGECKATTY